jgi:hypothetical protein
MGYINPPVRCVEVLSECACLLALEPVGGTLGLQCGAQQVLQGPRLVLQLTGKVNCLSLLQRGGVGRGGVCVCGGVRQGDGWGEFDI